MLKQLYNFIREKMNVLKYILYVNIQKNQFQLD